MKARAWQLAALALLAAAVARPHPAPNSMLRLHFEAQGVRGEYWLPVSELAHARARDPRSDLPAYLLRRVSAESPSGTVWRVGLKTLREDRYLDHDYLVAELQLVPPDGVAARPFVLIDDVITHEVRNHVVFVVQNHPDGNRLIGTLQYPTRRLVIPAAE